MSTIYLDLSQQISYDGTDKKILETLDDADRRKREICKLAGQRVYTIVAGRIDKQEKLTSEIDAMYWEWFNAMRRARQLIKAEKEWG